MADSDSFINEVTEEVRRDRLFAFFRRWAWAFVLVVLVIVGAAGYTEYRRAQVQSTAEAFGDAVVAALDSETPEERAAALEAIEPAGTGAEMLLALLIAGQETDGGDAEAAAARLREIGNREDMPERYRDLALLKAHMLAPGDEGAAIAMLDRLSRPGAPYRALAIEQRAYMMIRDGDIEGGQALLEEILTEAGTSPGLQQRVLQMMVALESGAELTDEPLPEPEAPALPELPVGQPLTEETDEEAAPTENDAPEAASE